jgi:hypothetical protein
LRHRAKQRGFPGLKKQLRFGPRVSALPDSLAVILRSDRTAALGALVVIAAAHRDLYDWATRAICGEPERRPEPKPNGAARRGRNGTGRRRNGVDHRLAKREADDEALVEAMKAHPAGSINDWARAINKSRTSCVSALHRLRDAGLAESDGGRWALVEPEAPREPVPRWIEPLSAVPRAPARMRDAFI